MNAPARPVNAVNAVNVRTEGQRLLLEVEAPLSEIAAAVNVGKTIVSYWRRGTKLPSEEARALLFECYQIDPSSWDCDPGVAPLEEEGAKGSADAARLGTTIEELDRQIRKLRELQDRGNMSDAALAKVATDIGQLLDRRDKMEQRDRLFEKRVVRDAPFWQRIRRVLAESLKPHPAAMKAVAEALRDVGA